MTKKKLTVEIRTEGDAEFKRSLDQLDKKFAALDRNITDFEDSLEGAGEEMQKVERQTPKLRVGLVNVAAAVTAARGIWDALRGGIDLARRAGEALFKGAVFAEIAEQMGASAEQSQMLTEAAVAMANAIGGSVEERARQLAKTMGGYGGELGEVMPELKSFTQEQLKSGAAIEYAHQRFMGTMGTARSMVGIVGELNSAFFIMRTRIGNAVTQNEVLLTAFEKLRDAVLDLSGDLDDDVLTRAISRFARIAVASIGVIGGAFLELRQRIDAFKVGWRQTVANAADAMAWLLEKTEGMVNGMIGALNSILPDWAQLGEVQSAWAADLRTAADEFSLSAKLLSLDLSKAKKDTEGWNAAIHDLLVELMGIDDAARRAGEGGRKAMEEAATGIKAALSGAGATDSGLLSSLFDVDRLAELAANASRPIAEAAAAVLQQLRGQIAGMVQEMTALGLDVSDAWTGSLASIDEALAMFRDRWKEANEQTKTETVDMLGELQGAFAAVSDVGAGLFGAIGDSASEAQRTFNGFVKAVQAGFTLIKAVQAASAAASAAQSTAATAKVVADGATQQAALIPAAAAQSTITFGAAPAAGAIGIAAATAGVLASFLGMVGALRGARVADKGYNIPPEFRRFMQGGGRTGEDTLVALRGPGTSNPESVVPTKALQAMSQNGATQVIIVSPQVNGQDIIPREALREMVQSLLNGRELMLGGVR